MPDDHHAPAGAGAADPPGDPRAAVVIPAYHADRFLAEAIPSVLDQDLAVLDLVIVDDGSTDRTLAVARSITELEARVITGPNRGGAAHGGEPQQPGCRDPRGHRQSSRQTRQCL
jgi:cellulose synthase/poly-beta-1,6-N-acetylglucosamine synthase-like glycosyltransferase